MSETYILLLINFNFHICAEPLVLSSLNEHGQDQWHPFIVHVRRKILRFERTVYLSIEKGSSQTYTLGELNKHRKFHFFIADLLSSNTASASYLLC